MRLGARKSSGWVNVGDEARCDGARHGRTREPDSFAGDLLGTNVGERFHPVVIRSVSGTQSRVLDVRFLMCVQLLQSPQQIIQNDLQR